MTTVERAAVTSEESDSDQPLSRMSKSRRVRHVLPRAWRGLRSYAGDLGQWSGKRKAVVLTPMCILLIALIIAVGLLGVRIHSNDQIAAAKASALAASNDIVPKLLSYRFDSIEKDLGDASNALTGDFKDQFVSLTQQTIIPSAKQASIVTATTVAGTSVVSASADSATVLMFLNQSTTSSDAPNPKLDSSRVRVQMHKVGDEWLIANLEPV